MSNFASFGMNVFFVVFMLFVFFTAGIFLYKTSKSINTNIVNNLGVGLYKLMCKSGFMVVLVIFITFFICKHTNDVTNITKPKETVISKK